MRRVVLTVSLLAALWAAPAWAAPQTGFVTMDDGVRLAYDLYTPATASPQPWPAVVVMHGLGGSKDSMAPIAQYFADHGYAALAFSVRGQGTSTGDFSLVSPRDVADMKAMVAWLEQQPGVSRTQVGCLGVSLGGGECWNATPTGIFKAVVPVTSWTDLYGALWSGGVARSGIVAGFAKVVDDRSPFIRSVENDAIRSTSIGTIVDLARQRSVVQRTLPPITTPVYMFQGRVDYAFDDAQVLYPFRALRGPRKLYIGDFGHLPATFASPDFPGYVLAQSLAWFDRFLRGQPNGIDKGPGLTLADRTGTRRTSYAGLPPTTTRTVAFGGAGRTRTGPRLARAVETFGTSTVRVEVRKLSNYPRLVAVLFANGKVVSHGGFVPHVGTVTIRLANYVTYIPKGARLTLRLGPDGGPADVAYLGFGDPGSISLGPATLNLQILKKAVSR